jgi:hypothetical protein
MPRTYERWSNHCGDEGGRHIVAVAAFGDWHRLNGAACAALDRGALIPAHALLETCSVLTGFPPPYRAAPEIVVDWLDDGFGCHDGEGDWRGAHYRRPPSSGGE